VLPIFEWLVAAGQVALDDQYRAFNMGVGLVVAVAAADVARTRASLDDVGQVAYEIGRVVPGSRTVHYV
jgi:phosphoribosylformylglycinamidine cyclo-ligase